MAKRASPSILQSVDMPAVNLMEIGDLIAYGMRERRSHSQISGKAQSKASFPIIKYRLG